MKKEELDYLYSIVIGSPEALKLFSHLRDEILSSRHQPLPSDPNNEWAKRDMAIAEVYQLFININQEIKKGIESERNSTNGEPRL